MALSFGTYISEEAALEGLENKTLFKGIIKLLRLTDNQVAVFKHDYSMIFQNYADLNCALDCDIVAARPKFKTHASKIQALEVVYILKKVHSRTVVGILKPPQSNFEFTLFSDRNKRMPMLRIPRFFWPSNFHDHSERYVDTLMLAKITKWTEPTKVWGEILEVFGSCGNIQAENLAIKNECHHRDYPIVEIPIQMKNKINLSMFHQVDALVFSVMDSRSKAVGIAFSCEELDDGSFQAGVHVSNVTCFLEKDSSLDKYIYERATTIWLENTVYHMLPEEFKTQCTLYPATDKPCISVFWNVSANGQVSHKKFQLTIIKSCAVLTAYDMENIANWASAEEIQVYHGYTRENLVTTLKQMKEVAMLLKEKRTKHTLVDTLYGSTFFINTQTHEPVHMMVVDREQMRTLFTEFTLFANFSIGEFIFDKFPHLAILRVTNSQPSTILKSLGELLKLGKMNVDASSKYNLKTSLATYTDRYPAYLLQDIASKFCWRQKYVCSDGYSKNDLFNDTFGYPIFAHGTAPLAKYADIIVQSLLESAITESEPQWTTNEVKNILEHCEIKEFLALKAKQKCTALFTRKYISCHQPFIQNAVVWRVEENCFMALIVDFGIDVKIYKNQVPNLSTWTPVQNHNGFWKITIMFLNGQRQVIQNFTQVKIQLTTEKASGNLKLVTTLVSI